MPRNTVARIGDGHSCRSEVKLFLWLQTQLTLNSTDKLQLERRGKLQSLVTEGKLSWDVNECNFAPVISRNIGGSGGVRKTNSNNVNSVIFNGQYQQHQQIGPTLLCQVCVRIGMICALHCDTKTALFQPPPLIPIPPADDSFIFEGIAYPAHYQQLVPGVQYRTSESVPGVVGGSGMLEPQQQSYWPSSSSSCNSSSCSRACLNSQHQQPLVHSDHQLYNQVSQDSSHLSRLTQHSTTDYLLSHSQYAQFDTMFPPYVRLSQENSEFSQENGVSYCQNSSLHQERRVLSHVESVEEEEVEDDDDDFGYALEDLCGVLA